MRAMSFTLAFIPQVDVFEEHLELFRLLRARDAEGARQSVQRHIKAFRATLFNRI
jgi:DNA-binding GntR family transcriptional regulator